VSLPNWETYGWAAFAIPAKPTGSPELKARLEVSLCGGPRAHVEVISPLDQCKSTADAPPVVGTNATFDSHSTADPIMAWNCAWPRRHLGVLLST
jgi:hypothetical protein